YPALWSLHDLANHHYRRYRRRTLQAAALESGWQVDRITPFNGVLLPAAAAVRLAQRGRQPDASYRPQLQLGPRWMNAALELPLRAEARWLGAGHTLRVGLSLLAVLRNASSPG